MSEIKAARTRNLRYKRPALASMRFGDLRTELWEIQSACERVHWFVDQEDETLLNALDGDEEAAWEFQMAFADLEAKADELDLAMQEYYDWDDEGFARLYDDCTVALIGNCYTLVGYDCVEEDYYALTSYDAELAQTEAGKRLMRLTKAEMISTIGQCIGTLLAFLDLRQQYDYLKATFDILRDENTSLLQTIQEIDAAYEAANAAGWVPWKEEVKKFDRLLDSLPDWAWVS